MIQKIVIQNYRKFREFELDFDPGMNIIVGDNNSGKSSLIEAINLALTGRVQGRFLSQEFSPFLLNLDATQEFIDALAAGGEAPVFPPELMVELYLEATDATESLRGTNNLRGEDACGIKIHGFLDPDYIEEYKSFIADAEKIRLVPTEYYKVSWLGFDDNIMTRKRVPAMASVIDPTTIRLQSGADYHLQQIIRTQLDPKQRAELSLQYRSLREEFTENPAVKEINERLADDEVTDRNLTLSIDISSRYTWESGLIAHLDSLPFPYIGRGDQNAVKTLLAIGRRTEDAHIVLIEEPENHLAFGSLRKLIYKIEERCEGKQVIVATHSSFVLNRLGLDHLILLGDQATARITDLPEDTADYFKKLSGYDTLRLVLAERSILVEGPSDELVVQRAYYDQHQKYPIEDGIDVINVRGLSFKRFLDLAVRLNKRVTVVTDNDGKPADEVAAKYADYVEAGDISIQVGEDADGSTLEPQIVAVNDLDALKQVLDTTAESKEELVKYMKKNKTSVALAIFESEHGITMPEYIRGAVA